MLDWFTNTILGPYVYDVLKPLLFKGNKFDLRRLLLISVVIAIGIFAYYLPTFIPKLSIGFGYYESVSQIPADSYAGRLLDKHYKLTNQYLYSFVYLTLILAVFARIVSKKITTLLNDESHKVALFARDVSLIDGSRCLNVEEKRRAEEKVAEKIRQSSTIRMMVINGYHDLHDVHSVIRREIEQKNRALHLLVLMLDPFSEYAKRRASNLLPETDSTLSYYRYIRDFRKTITKLNELSTHATIDYRVYCSNPFFRFYLFEDDFIFQLYQQNEHGHQTPMYHFSSGPRSMLQFGKELFKYHWNKGFRFDKEFLERTRTSFLLHLATMYGLYDDKDKVNRDELIRKIVSFTDKEIHTAEMYDKDGKFSGLDL